MMRKERVSFGRLECGHMVILALSSVGAIENVFDRATAEIDALVVKIREGVEELKEYRMALISAAVTGKIDARDEVPADTVRE
jgi:hypothetical protein